MSRRRWRCLWRHDVHLCRSGSDFRGGCGLRGLLTWRRLGLLQRHIVHRDFIWGFGWKPDSGAECARGKVSAVGAVGGAKGMGEKNTTGQCHSVTHARELVRQGAAPAQIAGTLCNEQCGQSRAPHGLTDGRDRLRRAAPHLHAKGKNGHLVAVTVSRLLSWEICACAYTHPHDDTQQLNIFSSVSYCTSRPPCLAAKQSNA